MKDFFKGKFYLLPLALFCMPVIAVAVLALSNSFQEHPLPIFGTVPPFQLTERSGEPIGNEFLARKVWVAGFIFTHCSGQCPIITARMQKIQKELRLKEKMRLVSITIDPDRDTAEVLKKYAVGAEADPYKWLFLTGKKKEITALVQSGFRLASDVASSDSMTHSDRLVLVDGYGRIRGYYDGNDDGEMKKLLKDSRSLLKQTF